MKRSVMRAGGIFVAAVAIAVTGKMLVPRAAAAPPAATISIVHNHHYKKGTSHRMIVTLQSGSDLHAMSEAYITLKGGAVKRAKGEKVHPTNLKKITAVFVFDDSEVPTERETLMSPSKSLPEPGSIYTTPVPAPALYTFTVKAPAAMTGPSTSVPVPVDDPTDFDPCA